MEGLWIISKRIYSFFKLHPNLVWAFKIAVVFSLFFCFGQRHLDPDFGWHLQSGNYIRQHGIPAHDIYTYTARNFPWIDHEWGNDVLVSYLYPKIGYPGLAVLFSAVWTAALMLGAGRKTRLVFLIVAVGALLSFSGVRTVAWTALGLVILLRMINSRSRAVRLSIPLLFIIWANLHGGFIIGLAVIAYYAVRERRLFWLYVLAGGILASFINPYGPRLYVEIFRTLGDRKLHHQISEWFPLNLSSFAWAMVALWISGFWLFSKKRLWDWLSVSSLLLVGALSANRNLPLFAVVAIKDLDGYYTAAKRKIPRNLNHPRMLLLVFFAAIFASLLIWIVRIGYLPLNANRERPYPTQAVAYLRAHPCSGNLFNDYNYGGYLIWKLPGKPVYIDGRMPSWKNPSGVKYIDTYFKLLKDKNLQASQFKKYDIRCALLENDDLDQAMIKRLPDEGWKLVVRANGSYLFLTPAK